MMSENWDKALCFLPEKTEISYVKQYITIKYRGTEVEYTISRDWVDGTNISDVEKHFQNLPYLSDEGEVCYHDDLCVLSVIFEKADEIGYIDQYLYDLNVGASWNADITLLAYDDIDMSDKKVNVVITLNSNELFYSDED